MSTCPRCTRIRSCMPDSRYSDELDKSYFNQCQRTMQANLIQLVCSCTQHATYNLQHATCNKMCRGSVCSLAFLPKHNSCFKIVTLATFALLTVIAHTASSAHAPMSTHVRAHEHTYVRAHLRACARAHTHKHTHGHTHARRHPRRFSHFSFARLCSSTSPCPWLNP